MALTYPQFAHTYPLFFAPDFTETQEHKNNSHPPYYTKNMKKNYKKHQKHKKIWDAWCKDWDSKRWSLRLVFKIWFEKNTDKVSLFILRDTLHCKTIKDCAWDFYNELISDMWSQIETQKKLTKIQKLNNIKMDSYLDSEEPLLRKSKRKKNI